MAIMLMESIRDRRRYLRAADWVGGNRSFQRNHLEGDIVRKYHVVEKALAMPDFRMRGGFDLVASLVADVNRWDHEFGNDEGTGSLQVEAARRSLSAYRKRHADLGDDLDGLLDDFHDDAPTEDLVGGVAPTNSFEAGDRQSLLKILKGRTSARVFEPELSLTDDELSDLAEIAIKAPSVCNRQTGRVHFYFGDKVQKLLEFQNGNRGFGHQVPGLIAVTSDMRYFLGHLERNQPYVDGGLFSMQLLLGLQGKGMGAVCLNWCVDRKTDHQFREIAEIPDHEVIIMLIGFGRVRHDALSPSSFRLEGRKVFTKH